MYLGQPGRKGHNTDFSSISILDEATRYVDCMIKKAIEMKLHHISFNRDGGFTVSPGTQ
jgi:hypothetical protein